LRPRLPTTVLFEAFSTYHQPIIGCPVNGGKASETKTWTEDVPDVVPQGALLTVRAGEEATRQVGELALPVAAVARELGVCWWTVMDAVTRHGTPLVEDPARVGTLRAMGVDETNFQAATREHPTIYASGLIDLDRRRVIDMAEGNSAADLGRWCARQDRRGFRPSR
jgi:transposase